MEQLTKAQLETIRADLVAFASVPVEDLDRAVLNAPPVLRGYIVMLTLRLIQLGAYNTHARTHHAQLVERALDFVALRPPSGGA